MIDLDVYPKRVAIKKVVESPSAKVVLRLHLVGMTELFLV